MAAEPLLGATRAKEQAERYHEATEKIRQRTDSTAKALAVVGSAAVTAIGYAKFGEVFPLGDSEGWWLVPLFLGVLAMVAAVIALVRRFENASKTVGTNPDLARTYQLNDFSTDEKEMVAELYSASVSGDGVESLRALSARGRRFERIAGHPGVAGADTFRARADQILTEVRATQERVTVFIVRARASGALFSAKSLAFLGVFIVGWYATAVAANAIQAEREERIGETEQISNAKSCAEAREKPKIVESQLPDICGELPASSAE